VYARLMTQPGSLVERKQRQARERIVQAAEELFATRDFDDVSVSDIAEYAEVGRTTFFRHFGDKQEVAFGRWPALLETIAAAAQEDDFAPVRSMTDAVEQLCPIVLTLCAQVAADPEDYVRHFRLVEQHAELQARYALKMQQFADKLSDVLIHRGADKPLAISAAQVALGCYVTARLLGDDPRTLVDEARAAFTRVLTLGAASTRA
jgi:AcrR family transcriptional regulator